jgi:hypothetical protein
MRLSRIRRALAMAVATMALSVAAVPDAFGAEVPDHQLIGSITGERIGVGGQFKGACGVAVDSQGDVYVADYYQNRIVVFNKKWEYLTQIDSVDPLDSAGVSPLDVPCDLAVDSAGRLYANDYHRDVARFLPATYPPQKGTTYGTREVIDTNHSTGVALDPLTDDLYVDDRTYLAHYEAPVTAGEPPVTKIGEGSLLDAYSVALSRFESAAPLIYAADAATETIKVYDPSLDPGSPQSQIHGEGTDPGGFDLTDTDLAVDPEDGHLYVSQNLEPHFEFTPEAVVEEFSPAGLYRGPVPRSFANGFESFLQSGEPSGLATHNGELYVTSGNYENAAVFTFGPPAPFDPRLLRVEKKGTGEGTVTSIPAAIGCGEVCEAEIAKEATVILKAQAAPGSAIAGWSGCDSVPAAGRCVVAMNAERKVTVEFEAAPAAASASLAPDAGATNTTVAPAVALTPGLGAGSRRPKARRAHHRRQRNAHNHRKETRR